MAKRTNIKELDGFHYLVDGRHGHFLANKNDEYVGGALITYGEFSELETEFFRSVVDKDTTVIEVGANIGAHTVWLAKHAKHVVAIEPQPFIFYTLCANVVLNSLTNVECLQLCISDALGMIDVPILDYSKHNNFGGLELGKEKDYSNTDTIRVPANTLLDTLFYKNIEGKVFLKIDVEGMELEVLKGAKDFIMKHRPVMYVENDRSEKSVALLDFIHNELNYKTETHRPRLFNPDNYFKKPDKWQTAFVSINEICTPL